MKPTFGANLQTYSRKRNQNTTIKVYSYTASGFWSQVGLVEEEEMTIQEYTKRKSSLQKFISLLGNLQKIKERHDNYITIDDLRTYISVCTTNKVDAYTAFFLSNPAMIKYHLNMYHQCVDKYPELFI